MAKSLGEPASQNGKVLGRRQESDTANQRPQIGISTNSGFFTRSCPAATSTSAVRHAPPPTLSPLALYVNRRPCWPDPACGRRALPPPPAMPRPVHPRYAHILYTFNPPWTFNRLQPTPNGAQLTCPTSSAPLLPHPVPSRLNGRAPPPPRLLPSSPPAPSHGTTTSSAVTLKP